MAAVATGKQSKTTPRRAQHATRRTPGDPPASEARDALAELVTDDKLLGWGRAEGLDLTVRAALLDAAAVGLTIALWRNTELENIHAGAELTADTDADRAALIGRLHAVLDADVAGYTGVADSAEGSRIALLLEQRRTAGAGIPDDVMMRLNVSTARTVRAALDDALPPRATQPGADLPYRRDALPEFLTAAVWTLLERDRPMTVGGATATAGELLGERGWAAYERDVYAQLARPAALADAVGARRALWFAALSGATYGGRWWPSTHWAGAVADLRASLAAGDLERVGYSSPPDRPGPAPDDEEFWTALTGTPELLNARQARWVIGSRLSARLHDRRRAAAAAWGAADAERFPILSALC